MRRPRLCPIFVLAGACVACGSARHVATGPSSRDFSSVAASTAASSSQSVSGAPVSKPAATSIEAGSSESAWGTAHPVLVAAAAPHDEWIAFCQAREDTNGDGRITVEVDDQGKLVGDRLSGYLATKPGPGDAIDAFAGNDPSGRFVAFVRAEHLILRDTRTNSDVDLTAQGADPRDDLSTFRHHRAIAFDPTGKRVAYIRRGPRPVVIVRELTTGSEASIDPGEGELWRMDFDAMGHWVVLQVVGADTNKNGRLDWTVREATHQSMRCPAALAKYPAWENPGDRATPRLALVSGGPALDTPNLVVPLGSALVERLADGAVVLRRSNGTYAPLAPIKCQARVVHADPVRNLVMTNCRQKNGHYALFLVGDGFEKALGHEMVAAGSDHWFEGSPRLVPIYGGSNDAALVDMETRDVIALQGADRVVATSGPHALIARNDRLVMITRGAGESVVEQHLVDFPKILRSERAVFVTPWVIDIEVANVLGRARGEPLALTTDGKTLIASTQGDVGHLPLGPLRWVAPEK